MIMLTEKDADKLLKYFREELKNENEEFEVAAAMIKDEIPENLKCKLNVLREHIHEHNVKVFTGFIELLTCGSEI